MRHELVFSSRADAEQAVARINATVLGVKDVQVQSDQSVPVVVHFRTDSPLEGWMVRYIIRTTMPDSYAFNQP